MPRKKASLSTYSLESSSVEMMTVEQANESIKHKNQPISLAQKIELQLAPTQFSANELLALNATDQNLKQLQDAAAPYALIEGIPTREQRDEASKIKAVAVSVRTASNKLATEKAKPYENVVKSLKNHAKYIGDEARKAQLIVEDIVDRYESEQERLRREKINEQENKINKRKEQLINLGFKYDGEIGYVLDAYRMENIDVRQMPDKQFDRAIFEYTSYVDTIAENKRLAAEQLENDKQQLQRDREQLRKDQKALEQQKAAQVEPEKLESIVTQLSGDIAPELKKPTVLEQLVHQGFETKEEKIGFSARNPTFPRDFDDNIIAAQREWDIRGTGKLVNEDALTAAMVKNGEDYATSEANRVDDLAREGEHLMNMRRMDRSMFDTLLNAIEQFDCAAMLSKEGEELKQRLLPYLHDVQLIADDSLSDVYEWED